MGTSEKINIKNLPQTLEIADGDFLIVEKNDGTYILDYADVVLESAKTVVTAQVEENTTAIADLSTSIDTKIEDLSAQVYSDITKVYIGKATITVTDGRTINGALSPRPTIDIPTLTVDDFIVTPANDAACLYPGYISEVATDEDNLGIFTLVSNLKRNVYTVSIDNTTDILNTTITTDMTTARLSTLSAQEFIDSLTVNTTNNSDLKNYYATVDTVDATVQELGVEPQYYVTVFKTFSV